MKIQSIVNIICKTFFCLSAYNEVQCTMPAQGHFYDYKLAEKLSCSKKFLKNMGFTVHLLVHLVKVPTIKCFVSDSACIGIDLVHLDRNQYNMHQ
jgi:hypothetical protein